MYVAELVTGDPAVFNSESCAAHLPQNPGTPAQSFHSTVFLGGTTTSGNTFRLFVDFSGQFQYSCSSRIFADFKNANKTSVHDVQIKLPGTGVRKPPVSLLFPECAGYEKPEIQSLL